MELHFESIKLFFIHPKSGSSLQGSADKCTYSPVVESYGGQYLTVFIEMCQYSKTRYCRW